jgi:uncharacterized protein YeaO (DUF488 family)
MILRVKTKRWDDPREADDGFRLLVCRYRPRGLAKDAETWDAWWKELGPSVALHAAAYGKDGQPLITWADYEELYEAEMRMPAPARKIAWLARSINGDGSAGDPEPLTLLCSSACVDENRCHRTLLRQLIERAAARQGSTS